MGSFSSPMFPAKKTRSTGQLLSQQKMDPSGLPDGHTAQRTGGEHSHDGSCRAKRCGEFFGDEKKRMIIPKPWVLGNHMEFSQMNKKTVVFELEGTTESDKIYLHKWDTKSSPNQYWLVVSTHLKNISQIGSSPQGSW